MDKKKILLVIDDEKPIADGIRMMLESSEYNCVVAYSGKDGLIKTREQTPDLVLLDINMPEADGFQVLKTLKNDVTTARMPVIMVTSCDTPDDIETAYKLGAAEYVIKPINFDDLRNKIAKVLG